MWGHQPLQMRDSKADFCFSRGVGQHTLPPQGTSMLIPHAIVFDVDGTLLDTSADIVSAMNHAFAARGRAPLEAAGFLRFVGDGARMLCARAAGLPEDHPEVTALVDAYVSYYVEHPLDKTTFMPGARAALEALRNYKLAICTNKPRPATEAVLANLGITHRFATMVAGGDMPERKPDPQPVLEIARRLSLQPAQLVVVGDGPQDVEAGRRAGARTVGIVGTIVPLERLRTAGPDVLLDSMTDLPGVMERWAQSTVRASSRLT
jgi:phosphoglycolate phosphatase